MRIKVPRRTAMIFDIIEKKPHWYFKVPTIFSINVQSILKNVSSLIFFILLYMMCVLKVVSGRNLSLNENCDKGGIEYIL